MQGEIITGRLATGIGQGKHFTRLDWARQQFIARVGIDPYPGTINIIVDDADQLARWQRLAATTGIRIDNPGDGPHDCDARCYPVMIEGRFDAAIVLPEVDAYTPAQIEIISAVCIRDALALADGDTVRLLIR